MLRGGQWRAGTRGAGVSPRSGLFANEWGGCRRSSCGTASERTRARRCGPWRPRIRTLQTKRSGYWFRVGLRFLPTVREALGSSNETVRSVRSGSRLAGGSDSLQSLHAIQQTDPKDAELASWGDGKDPHSSLADVIVGNILRWFSYGGKVMRNRREGICSSRDKYDWL